MSWCTSSGWEGCAVQMNMSVHDGTLIVTFVGRYHRCKPKCPTYSWLIHWQYPSYLHNRSCLCVVWLVCCLTRAVATHVAKIVGNSISRTNFLQEDSNNRKWIFAIIGQIQPTCGNFRNVWCKSYFIHWNLCNRTRNTNGSSEPWNVNAFVRTHAYVVMAWWENGSLASSCDKLRHLSVVHYWVSTRLYGRLDSGGEKNDSHERFVRLQNGYWPSLSKVFDATFVHTHPRASGQDVDPGPCHLTRDSAKSSLVDEANRRLSPANHCYHWQQAEWISCGKIFHSPQ